MKATRSNSITFDAEIKSVSSKKLASGDVEYRVTLDSPDGNVLNLGLVAPDVLVTVTVEVPTQ